jgi:serine/threonine protein phosphatase PrpC
MPLNYSLADHPQGYAINWYDVLPGFIHSPYAIRHLELANSSETPRSHRLGHRLIAALEFIPVLGFLASLIERIVIAVFNAFSEKNVETDELPTEITADITENLDDSVAPVVDAVARNVLAKRRLIRRLSMTPSTMPIDFAAAELKKVSVQEAEEKMHKNFQLAIEEKLAIKGNHSIVPSIDQVPLLDNRQVARDLKLTSKSCGLQSLRPNMEDAHFCVNLPQGTLTGVCDGHDDKGEIAQYIVKCFKEQFSDILKASHPCEAFEKMIEKIENEVAKKLLDDPTKGGGATLAICFIDKKNHKIYTATLGDTEAKIYRPIAGEKFKTNIKCIPLSVVRNWLHPKEFERAINWFRETIAAKEKQAPENANEAQALKSELAELRESQQKFEAHKKLADNKKNKDLRFPGGDFGLNVSRAIGDSYAQPVSHKAIITMTTLLPEDLLVIGCDGVWDFIEDSQLIKNVLDGKMSYADRNFAEDIANYSRLFHTSVHNDNISVVTLHVK